MARARTNLGAERTPFVGREAERSAVAAALAAGARLVTLVGPPGIGKTRLSRSVAAMTEPPAGGSWFCDLTHARTEGDLLASVSAALGLPPHAGGAQGLGDALAGRGPTLLVLDNFESLVPAALPPIERWLDDAPELQLLVTSRVLLGVEGETAFEIGPLALDEAVRLYELRAAAAWADRRRDAAEAAAVRELVQRLDRVPLAVELAAARIRVLSPADLLERLADRFALLQGPRRGRFTSLREAIACSFELLSPEERAALLQVSVFRGGFTLDGAAGVVRLPGAPPLVDVLEGLREKSLLRREPGEPARFSLFESVRDFAAAELRAAGDAAAVEARHAAWFVAAGEAWAAAAPGPEGAAAVRALQAERENLVAVHLRACDDTPELAARAALALSALFALHGPPAAESGLFDRAVDAARRTGDPALLARALAVRANAAARRGLPDDARRDIDEAVAMAAGAGAAALRAEIALASGKLRCNTGDFAAARADVERGLADVAGSGSWLEGWAHNLLGMVEERTGRLDASAERFEAALAIYRRSAGARWQGIALVNLGVIRAAAGRIDDARALLEEALALLRRADDRATEADAIVDLASVELTAGRLDEAEAHLLRGLALERQLGNRRFEGLALGNLGLVAQERMELRLAWKRLREALDVLHACGEKRFHALFLPFFAATEAALGMHAEARADFAAARAWFAPLGDAASLAAVDALEAFLDLAAGDEASARARLARAATAEPSAELQLARRLVDAALERRQAPAEAAPPGASENAAGLVVERESAWFQFGAGEPVDLRRRGPLRRLLQALVEQRLLAPGIGLSAEQLFSQGWPGQQILPTAASNRVYTGVRALRSMGLSEVLQRHAEGYLLDPAVPLQRR